MTPHNYNTRLNSFTWNEETTLTEVSTSNDAIVDAPSQTNVTSSQFSETATLIVNLEKRTTYRFDGLDNELLNLRDVTTKNPQVENERLRKKVNDLENKFLTLESEHNLIEQYVRRNNIEIHRVGVSKNNSKKTIVYFINRKHTKKALISRKNLRKSWSPNCNVFINENLTVKNNDIAFLSRKLNRSSHLTKIYTRDGTTYISSPEIHRGKVLKIYRINVLKIYRINDLFNLFPYYDFRGNYRENDQNDSLQSSYWLIL